MSSSTSSTLSLLAEFGGAALDSANLDEIGDRAVKCAAQALRVDKAAILLRDSDATLLPHAWIGWNPTSIARIPFDLAGPGPAAQVFRSESAMCFSANRDFEAGDWPEFLISGGINSVMCASIGPRRSRYGVIEAHAEDSHHFDSEDSAFLLALAYLLSAAFVRLGRSPLDSRATLAAPIRANPIAPPTLTMPVLTVEEQVRSAAALIDHLPMGVAFFDASGTILHANMFYQQCLSAEIVSENATLKALPVHQSAALEDLSLRLPDGNDMWVSLQGFPVRDTAKRHVGSCNVITDISRWKAAKHRVPNPDLPHRIRNILSVVRVIARRTAERSESVEDYAARLESRISALARVQTGMFADPNDGVDLGIVIADELLAHSVKGDQVKADGPRVKLWPKAAEALALTVHELTENAIQYGALSVKSGHIEIDWRIDSTTTPDRLEFEWRESGVPVIGAAPRRRGFGHELIERTLLYELAATTSIEFRPGGMHCAIAIPLTNRTGVSQVFEGDRV
jgi:two-component sensor histidine kinase